MSAIRLVNEVPASAAASAEFRVSQGSNQIARIGVHSGGMASLPTTSSWQVQASTTMGDFALTSNVLVFTGPSAGILAQVLSQEGYYDFQIVQSPGTHPSAIVLENTWRNPVQFQLTQPGTPTQIVQVVDEHNNTIVITAQEWSVYAIVNGITTPNVTITDPNATVTVRQDDNDAGFTLVVS
ncbi:MAG TPA: hypothetical protein VHW00_06165 [Thermoanaerobaculia bacterium]|nr:hypothetical protein [Thermoanaerobaculia bacterium]